VIGDPISHSKSPLIHNFWRGKLGIEGEYRATKVTETELSSFLERRSEDPLWRGCNVTMPLKQSVMPFLGERRDDRVGAINCIVPGKSGLVGHNTDVDGVHEAIRLGTSEQVQAGSSATSVTLIGTGGAARAAMAALRGFDVTVVGRDLSKARALAEEFGAPGHASLQQCGEQRAHSHVYVNATSLGMRGHPALQIALDGLPPDTVIIDMVYDPLETALLAEARKLGLVTVDGLVMLIGQAASAFTLLFGETAPREFDAELRALLTQ
jgi:shikimate dehydrogenase